MILLIAQTLIALALIAVSYTLGFDNGFKKALERAVEPTMEIIQKRDEEWIRKIEALKKEEWK